VVARFPEIDVSCFVFNSNNKHKKAWHARQGGDGEGAVRSIRRRTDAESLQASVRRHSAGWRSVGARALSLPFFLAMRKKGIRDAKEMGTIVASTKKEGEREEV
jgi:hypothetical protein